MNRIKCLVPTFFLLSLLCAAGSSAEGGRVCMGGEIDQLNPAQLHLCQAQVARVREASVKYQVPAWHFIVICDEAGWSDYATFSERPASVLSGADADTNLAQRTTFLRGAHLNEQAGETVLATEMSAIVRQARMELAENH